MIPLTLLDLLDATDEDLAARREPVLLHRAQEIAGRCSGAVQEALEAVQDSALLRRRWFGSEFRRSLYLSLRRHQDTLNPFLAEHAGQILASCPPESLPTLTPR